MLTFINVFGLGLLFFIIGVTNFWWINQEVRRYTEEDEKEVDMILLMTRMPIEKLMLIQRLTILSIPLLFSGLFALIFSMTL